MEGGGVERYIKQVEEFAKIVKESISNEENGTFLLAGIVDKQGKDRRASIWTSCSIGDKSSEDVDADILETLQIAFNPTRIKILEFCLHPRKQSEIEKFTGLKGGGLYHHLRLLEFSKLLEKRKNEGYITTQYGTFVVVLARRASKIFRK